MNAKTLLRLQRPLLYALCSMPVSLLFCQRFMPRAPFLCCLLPAVHLAVVTLLCFTRGRFRPPVGIAGVGLVVAAGLLGLPWQEHRDLIACITIYAALTLAAMPMGGRETDQELLPWTVVAGLVLYLGAQVIASGQVRMHGFSALQTPLLVCFLLYLLLVMLMLNRLGLQSATLGGGAPPPALKRYGIFLTLGLFALTLLVASIPAISRLLRSAYNAIKLGVMALCELLMSLFPSGGAMEPGGGGGAMDFSLLAEPAQQSPLATILERIFMVIALLVFIVLLCLFLRTVWRTIKRAVLRLLEHLRSFGNASTADYVDEVVDIRDDPADAADTAAHSRRRRRHVDLSRLTPREQIRAAYASLLRRHPEWNRASTARETLPVDASALYERARYSDHDIVPSDAQSFEQTTRPLWKRK